MHPARRTHAPGFAPLAAGLLIATLASSASGQGCNMPPIPAPGEEVTWTAAGGPYVLCNDVTLPAGSTVIVEAGTAIDIVVGRFLYARGTFLAEGTAENRVTLSGDPFGFAPLKVYGLMDLRFADVGCRTAANPDARLVLSDCAITARLDAVGGAFGATNPFVSLDRCTDTATIYVQHGTLAIRDTAIAKQSVSINNGYLLADGLSIDTGQLWWRRDRGAQPAYMNNITVTNFTDGGAMELVGMDFFFGPDNVLVNNLYPVTLFGGMLAGSTIPVTGNIVNVIDAGDGGIFGPSRWGAMDVPYRVNGATGTGALLTIDPGTVVEFTSGSLLNPDRFRAYGRPEAPITFRGVGPGTIWDGIFFQSVSTGPAFKHCIIDGARLGVAPADTPGTSVESCLFRNNVVGVNASTYAVLDVHKCRFKGNQTGVRETATGTVRLNDPLNPNAFDGNTLAVDGTISGGMDAANCWWGDPSRPTHSSNPGGTGDPVTNSVFFDPFLTSPPDADDQVPIVRMMKPGPMMETGQKVFILWDAEDDGDIVSQRILFSEHGSGESNYSVLVDDLPGSQRSYELTVPVALPSSINSGSFIRIIATDDAGQEGFDEYDFFIPYLNDVSGGLTSVEYPGPYTIGEHHDVCWQVNGGSGTIYAALLVDGDDIAVNLGGAHTGVDCLSLGVWMPYVSTDTARMQLSLNLGAGGRTAIFHSNEFTIRPDELIGDAPPVIDVALVGSGPASACGVTIPIAWTASDDEALRSFDIQASYDGARTWHFIARDLPADARSYDWHVDPIDGIPDVRVRVLARDLRFQTTSDGADSSFAIPPGNGAPPLGDIDGDCAVGFSDIIALLGAWGPCRGQCPEDLDDDGIVGFSDLIIILSNWT